MTRQILTARQWEQRLDKLVRMSAAERREFERLHPAEMSVVDLRDQAVGMVLAAFRAAGGDEEAFAACRERGGASPATLRAWRGDRVRAPRLTKIRETLRTTGHDLQIVRTNS